MPGHPQLLTRSLLDRVVVLESAGVGAVVDVGDAVRHGDVAHVGQLVLHDLETQVGRRVGAAVVVQFDLHIAIVEHLAMFDHLVGRHHLGAQRRLVGPALHQAAPEIAFIACDLVACVGQRMDGQVLAIGVGEGLVAQPVVAVVVAVEDRDHRLGRHGLDHADRHLADLYRSAGVQHHHALLGDGEDDAGHQPLVFLRRKALFGIDHPDVRRQLLGFHIGHRRPLDELVHLLGKEPHFRNQGQSGHPQPRAPHHAKPCAAAAFGRVWVEGVAGLCR